MARVNHPRKENRLLDQLGAFGARDAVQLHNTDLARIFKVTLEDGTPGVLKLYHGADMDDEAPGIDLLQAAKGVVAVDILKTEKNAVLMGYLEGPSLGDISREGKDKRANQLLIDGIAQFHAALPVAVPGMIPLEKQFRDLFALEYGPGCPSGLRQDMARATHLAKSLLAAPGPIRPLHGDIHHDNAILTKGGVKFIDAKGLIGELGFEIANSFRNPHGSDAIVCSPERVRHLVQIIASRLGVEPKRQLAWAVAQCALSIAWNAGKTLSRGDAEHTVLSMLLAVSDEAL